MDKKTCCDFCMAEATRAYHQVCFCDACLESFLEDFGDTDREAAIRLECAQPAPQPARDVAGLLAEAISEADVAGSFRDLINRLATALRDAEAARVKAEEIKEEQRRIGVRALQAANDAQSRCNAALARAEAAEAQLALCAQNTAAADLAQEVEFLRAEIAAMKEATHE